MHRRGEIDVGGCVLAAAVLSAATALIRPAGALAADAPTTRTAASATESAKAPCFLRREWRGSFRATPDARTIYIRVSGSIYRLDLQSSYPLLKDPFSVLRNRDSAEMICTPLDFRLTVSNRIGAEESPIVKHMTRLTPAEAAALPKRLKP